MTVCDSFVNEIVSSLTFFIVVVHDEVIKLLNSCCFEFWIHLFSNILTKQPDVCCIGIPDRGRSDRTRKRSFIGLELKSRRSQSLVDLCYIFTTLVRISGLSICDTFLRDYFPRFSSVFILPPGLLKLIDILKRFAVNGSAVKRWNFFIHRKTILRAFL